MLTQPKEPLPFISNEIKIFALKFQSAEKYSLIHFVKLALFPESFFRDIADQIDKICKEEKFNILHFHILPKDLPIGSLVKKRNTNIRLVYSDHSLRISKYEAQKLGGRVLIKIYKKFYNDFNTIFVSRQAFELAKSLGFIKNNRINAYVENTINIGAFRKKTSYTINKRPSIVYVSRISPAKGHLLLIEVAQLLKSKYDLSEFEFVIIGPDELNGKLQQEINANGLQEYFNLTGSCDDIAGILADFDIGVFPSEREGLPVALLEKMAAGLPVVASDIPEIKNVIQNPDEALLFRNGDAEDCAAKLATLLMDEKLREKIGHSARLAVDARYSQPLFEKYTGFYRKVLQ